MNTAVQTVELPINSTEAAGEVIDGIASQLASGQMASGQLTLGQSASEQQLRQAADRVAWLQSKVKELRGALSQARRRQFHQELLLRNSRLRELELRAQLIEWRQTDESQIEK